MNSPCTHEPLSPAVQRCCDARNLMIQITRSAEQVPQPPENLHKDRNARTEFEIEVMTMLSDRDPSLAYRSIMPQPTTREAIQDYIACVLHGIAIKAIDEGTGTKLLYGAQIAIAALPKEAKEKRTYTPTPVFDTSRFR